jgi:hypothetical protein
VGQEEGEGTRIHWVDFYFKSSLPRFIGDMSEEQQRQLEVFKKYIKDNNVTDHP